MFGVFVLNGLRKRFVSLQSMFIFQDTIGSTLLPSLWVARRSNLEHVAQFRFVPTGWMGTPLQAGACARRAPKPQVTPGPGICDVTHKSMVRASGWCADSALWRFLGVVIGERIPMPGLGTLVLVVQDWQKLAALAAIPVDGSSLQQTPSDGPYLLL